MSTQDETNNQEGTPVKELPYYITLRTLLEPYTPAEPKDADETFTTKELIAAIEEHHGVAQGMVGPMIITWVMPDDFVRAMRTLGYRDVNTGGLQLQWPMKKK